MTAATVNLMPIIKQQFLDNNGLPLAFGQIYTYAAGTSTPQVTYQDAGGVSTNTNPIILDASGRANVWLDITLFYKFVVQDVNSVTLYTEDNVAGTAQDLGGVTSIYAGTGISVSGHQGNVIVSATSSTTTEWTPGPTASYVSSTSFSVAGNQTTVFNVGRRVKATVSAGTVYGTVISSVLTSITTVTLLMDGAMVIDAGISAVWYGFVSGTPTSTPAVFGTTPVSMVSAATLNIGGSATSTILLSGNTSVTAFDSVNSGAIRNIIVQPASYPIITYNATSVILPGLANLAMNPGDCATFVSLGSGNWQCTSFSPAVGLTPVGTADISALFPITASVSGNALTVGLNPCRFDLRNVSTALGTPLIYNLLSSISLTVPTTATLGTVGNTPSRLVLIAYYYGGTLELGIINQMGNTTFDERQLISTTTISSASTASNVVYSTTGRAGVPYRVVGTIDITESIAGTWASGPTNVQGVGGNTLVNPIPEVIIATNNVIYTRSYVGPVKIKYMGSVFQGGLSTLAWNFLLNGNSINSWSGVVNYMVAVNPTWEIVFMSNGSFTMEVSVYPQLTANQIIIEYL